MVRAVLHLEPTEEDKRYHDYQVFVGNIVRLFTIHGNIDGKVLKITKDTCTVVLDDSSKHRISLKDIKDITVWMK